MDSVGETTGGFPFPEDVQLHAGDISDTSSICQSPIWEDAEMKKRKREKQEAKEKRRKEKEKLGRELRQKKSPKKQRLTKAPPANKKFSKNAAMDQANSIPPISSASSRQIRAEHTTSKEGDGSVGEGYFSFIQATKGIRGAWNAVKTDKFPSPREEGASIEGLKLNMAKEVAVEELQGQPPSNTLSEEDITKVRAGSEGFHKNHSSSRVTLRQKQPSSSHPLPPSRTAPTIPDTSRIVETSNHVVERNTEEGVQGRMSAAEKFPSDSQVLQSADGMSGDVARSDSPLQSPPLRNARAEQSHRSARLRKANASPKRPPISYREPPGLMESSRGRERSGSYVNSHRQQSRDSSINSYEDERFFLDSTSGKPQSRGRSWSIQSMFRRRRNSTDINSRPPTGSSAQTHDSSGDIYQRFLVDGSNSSELSVPSQNPISPLELPANLSPGSSTPNPTTSSFHGLKNAAKAAFSRHSYASGSPATTDSSSSNAPSSSKDLQPRLKKRPSNLNFRSSERNADRGLGTSIATQSPEPWPLSSGVPRSGRFQAESTLLAENESSSSAHSGSRNGLPPQSRSATGSSEDSTFDYSTNATTPTLSTPNSQQGRSPVRGEQRRRDFAGLNSHPVTKDAGAVTSGVLSNNDEVNSHYERKSGTTVTSKLNDYPDRLNTRSIVKSSPDLLDSQSDILTIPPNGRMEKVSNTDIQRHPSLARSISNPDLQDFRYLPNPKHESPNEPVTRKVKRMSSKDDRDAKSNLASGPSTHALLSSSSPSQHLRTARLSAPLSPSPKLTNQPFPPPTTAMSTNNPTQLAKIFVICCTCHYFHDLPSKIYECMTKPDETIEDKDLGVKGVVSMGVKCPWCGHGMTRECCEGWMGVVRLVERLH